MLLPTSLVGSYPQPDWLIDRGRLAGFVPRVRARELWRVAPEFLGQAQGDATLLAIRAQEDAGLDVITDGEIRRESYSNRFATALDGVDIDNPGSALDRSGHPNPVPRVVGKIQRRHAVQVEDVAFLRRHTRARGHGLCVGRKPGDPGLVPGRSGRRANRRALYASSTRRGPRVGPAGSEQSARGHPRSDRRAYLLRLCRHHPFEAQRI